MRPTHVHPTGTIRTKNEDSQKILLTPVISQVQVYGIVVMNNSLNHKMYTQKV